MENKFLSKNVNDKYSSLLPQDKKELLDLINNFDIKFQNCLGLPMDITFGFELEYELISRETVDFYIASFFDNWVSKEECSIAFGGEVSSPILNDSITNWNAFSKICDWLKNNGAQSMDLCAAHIHVGAGILDDNVEYWKNFLKLFAAYETVITRFGYGDKTAARLYIDNHSQPIANLIKSELSLLDSIDNFSQLSYFAQLLNKERAINLKNVKKLNMDCSRVLKDTIEFRYFNGTLNPVIWQNNLNSVISHLLSCKTDELDQDLIYYRINNMTYNYNEINLTIAFEYVDMIFRDNYSKTMFLRQYLKEYQIDKYKMRELKL